MKVDKDASDCSVNESKDVLVRNEEKEEKQEKEEEEMETWATNRSYKKNESVDGVGIVWKRATILNKWMIMEWSTFL